MFGTDKYLTYYSLAEGPPSFQIIWIPTFIHHCSLFIASCLKFVLCMATFFSTHLPTHPTTLPTYQPVSQPLLLQRCCALPLPMLMRCYHRCHIHHPYTHYYCHPYPCSSPLPKPQHYHRHSPHPIAPIHSHSYCLPLPPQQQPTTTTRRSHLQGFLDFLASAQNMGIPL